MCRAAKVYLAAGFSLIPIRATGDKRPEFDLLPRRWDAERGREVATWKQYRQDRPTRAEVRRWFRRGGREAGMAVLTGCVSGRLTVIDLDNWDVVGPWVESVEAAAPGLLARLVLVQTRGPGCTFTSGRRPSPAT